MAEKVLNTSGVNFTPSYLEPSGHPEYGGAEVIRMIINSDKVNPSHKATPGDAALFTEAKGKNDSSEPSGIWHLDPKGVLETIIAHDLRGGTRFFESLFPATQQIQANEKIIYTIEEYEVAPAVLIGGGPQLGGIQWLCVTGYNTKPVNSLNWFKIHDPSFDAGTGAFYQISANTWNTTYFKPVQGGVRWNNQFVTICDPDPDRVGLESGERTVKRSGEVLISPDEAVELAREGVNELELERFSQVAEALERTNPVSPILVNLLDQADTFYYIVPFESQEHGRKKTLAAIIVDARFGDLWGTVANPQGFSLIRFSPDDVCRLLIKQKFFICEQIEKAWNRMLARIYTWGEAGRARDIDSDAFYFIEQTIKTKLDLIRQPFLRPETIDIRSTLVWSASENSTSPFLPFYVVTSGLQTFYVRAVDGAIVLNLDCCRPWLLRLGG